MLPWPMTPGTAGLAGIPFGINIEPQLTVSHSRAQSLLLDFTEAVYVQQYEAGYRWSGGTIDRRAPGRRGRHLDITESLRSAEGKGSPAVVSYMGVYNCRPSLSILSSMDSSRHFSGKQSYSCRMAFAFVDTTHLRMKYSRFAVDQIAGGRMVSRWRKRAVGSGERVPAICGQTKPRTGKGRSLH